MYVDYHLAWDKSTANPWIRFVLRRHFGPFPFRFRSRRENHPGVWSAQQFPWKFRTNLSNRWVGSSLLVFQCCYWWMDVDQWYIFCIVGSGPLGASVPALGLSNKPVYQVEALPIKESQSGADQYSENYFVPTRCDGKNGFFLLSFVGAFVPYFALWHGERGNWTILLVTSYLCFWKPSSNY